MMQTPDVSYAQLISDLPSAHKVLTNMRGGSRSALVLDSSNRAWVLKMRHNPQHEHVVFNEYLGTHLARRIGLTVPNFSLMSANKLSDSEKIFANELLERNRDQVHFASSYLGYCPFERTAERLPDHELKRVTNIREFAGILVLDLWLANRDARQVMFMRKGRSQRYTAYWIDFERCLYHRAEPLNTPEYVGRYRSDICYRPIRSMLDFEPWLTAVEEMQIAEVETFVGNMPRELYQGVRERVDGLMLELSVRQRTVRRDLLTFIQSRPDIFCRWGSRKYEETRMTDGHHALEAERYRPASFW